mmetsp:Transcript_37250/g.45021  ORF Transcript_37250/g.45021 Transcript_37250/m.45021 type:complete len:229 (-) Transcript_37250:918-1604(-)
MRIPYHSSNYLPIQHECEAAYIKKEASLFTTKCIPEYLFVLASRILNTVSKWLVFHLLLSVPCVHRATEGSCVGLFFLAKSGLCLDELLLLLSQCGLPCTELLHDSALCCCCLRLSVYNLRLECSVLILQLQHRVIQTFDVILDRRMLGGAPSGLHILLPRLNLPFSLFDQCSHRCCLTFQTHQILLRDPVLVRHSFLHRVDISSLSVDHSVVHVPQHLVLRLPLLIQ